MFRSSDEIPFFLPIKFLARTGRLYSRSKVIVPEMRPDRSTLPPYGLEVPRDILGDR